MPLAHQRLMLAQWFAIAILLLISSHCLAQYTTGLVQGSVLDPSGALVKDASV